MQLTALAIVKELRANGHEAYFAGGFVRDLLLGLKPKDIDIATSATPDQLEKIFPKTVAVGRDFGVMLVLSAGKAFEVATFRSDHDYEDGRRPSRVEFVDAKADAYRRDFTINGLFYDPVADQILDFVGGQDDLEKKLICFIGDPEARILEDHLRIIRAVRFKNAYNLQYHPATYAALKKYANLLAKVAGERIQLELDKILVGPNRDLAIRDMEDLGLLNVILPEVQDLKGLAQPYQYHQEGDVFEHTMLALKSMPTGKPVSLYWAVLLHDVGKKATFSEDDDRIRYDGHARESANMAQKILKRFNYPQNLIKKVSWLCLEHMSLLFVLEMPKPARIKWFLKPWFLDLLAVHKADVLGTVPSSLEEYQQIRKLYSQDVGSLPQRFKRLITGDEVMAICGLAPGPKLGEIMEALDLKQQAGELVSKLQARAWLKKEYA